MAPKIFTPMKYVADSGATFAVGMADYITSQTGVGGDPKVGAVQATPGDAPKPGSFKMRRALVYDAVSGSGRAVACLTTTAELWTDPAATIQLYVGNPPTLTTFRKYGTQGERSRHSRRLGGGGTGG